MSTEIAPPTSYRPSRPCPSCGREWGPGIACQFCSQVEGLPTGIHLSSPARRFGGYVLEAVLAVFTLGIGWLVWALVMFGRGQTPAKQLLGMRTVDLRRGEKASWGKMFVREIIAKPLVGLAAWLTLGLVNFWLVWDSRNQELWDKIVGTIVVNDQHKQLAGVEAADSPAALQPRRDLADRLPFPGPAEATEERVAIEPPATES